MDQGLGHSAADLDAKEVVLRSPDQADRTGKAGEVFVPEGIFSADACKGPADGRGAIDQPEEPGSGGQPPGVPRKEGPPDRPALARGIGSHQASDPLPVLVAVATGAEEEEAADLGGTRKSQRDRHPAAQGDPTDRCSGGQVPGIDQLDEKFASRRHVPGGARPSRAAVAGGLHSEEVLARSQGTNQRQERDVRGSQPGQQDPGLRGRGRGPTFVNHDAPGSDVDPLAVQAEGPEKEVRCRRGEPGEHCGQSVPARLAVSTGRGALGQFDPRRPVCYDSRFERRSPRRGFSLEAKNMFAVIETGGKQYRVSPGDILEVERLAGEPAAGDLVKFERVLLLYGEGGTRVGNPTIPGASVEASVLDEVRGPKVTIFKFKRRKGHRRRAGHRQDYLRIRIGSVRLD